MSTVLAVEAAKLQVLTLALDALQLSDPVDKKTQVKQALRAPHKTVRDASQAALTPLFLNRPDLLKDIDSFYSKYSHSIELITKSSWKALKAEMGNEMHTLEPFRQEANACINQITCELARELGLEPATFTCCGTVGYDSDFDFTVSMKRPNIEDAVLYKTLRDCVHIFVLGDLSGKQLDTECYIPHPAEYNLAQYLNSEEAKLYSQTGEELSVHLQRLMSLWQYPEAYNRSKKRDLESITDPEEKKAMERLAEHAEAIWKVCRTENPIPLRIRMGEKASLIQKEIETEKKKIESVAVTRNHPSEKELDRLHLDLQGILILLALLQDEGTISASEGSVTLLKEGGQLSQRAVKARANSISDIYQGNTQVLREEREKDPQWGRKASLPLMNTARTSCELIKTYLHHDLTERLTPRFLPPTTQMLITAAHEEAMQLEHVFAACIQEQQKPKIMAIKLSKYGHRITYNLLKALNEFADKTDPRQASLISQAMALHAKCESLEKCKRQTTLATPGAAILLTKAIVREQGDTEARTYLIKTQSMFHNFDYDRIFFKEPPAQKEHLEFLQRYLLTQPEIGLKQLSPAIMNILKAHAGFDRLSDKKIQKIHTKARKLTLEKLELTEKAELTKFVSDLLELGERVRNIARSAGVLPRSTPYDLSKWLQ